MKCIQVISSNIWIFSAYNDLRFTLYPEKKMKIIEWKRNNQEIKPFTNYKSILQQNNIENIKNTKRNKPGIKRNEEAAAE